jgi:hypothetical protein
MTGKDMKIIVLLLCVLLSSCVRNQVPPEPVPVQAPVLQELVLLHEMHGRFLAFRDKDIFLRHGFTFNSPYADWLQQVREFELNPSTAEAARLLAGLAVAARIHGVQSEVYKQFETRFDQALRGSVGQESVDQESVASVAVAEEAAGEESAVLPPVEQEPVKQEPVAQVVVAGETAEPLPVEQELVEQKTVEHAVCGAASGAGGCCFTRALPCIRNFNSFQRRHPGCRFPATRSIRERWRAGSAHIHHRVLPRGRSGSRVARCRRRIRFRV